MKFYDLKYKKREKKHGDIPRREGSGKKPFLPLCLLVILCACLSLNGTFAFMQEKTGVVTNTFRAGNITYILNLNANADNVDMPSELAAKSLTSRSAVFTPDKAPTKTGYTFGGWYYDTTCTDENLHTEAPGTSITVNYEDSHDQDEAANRVEITLYAKWIANTYEVAYYGNGATSGSMENSTHVYDVKKKLTANVYQRTGYRFLGWSTEQNAAEASYEEQQEVLNLASEKDTVVDLYAVWERRDFTVSFDTQAADVAAPEGKTVTYQEAYGELPSLTRTGYAFEGWSLEPESSIRITSTSIVETAADHTLYAQWTPYTYTVKYENNVDPKNNSVTQPTGTTADSVHTYDTAKKLTANGFTRTGYTFIGWNTQPDGKGTSYANEESVLNLTSVSNGTVTLYAQWGVKTYVLRYHANGGQGEMADQIIEWDKLTKISKNQFVNNTGDYKFAGWATAPDGPVVYLDEQQVVNLLESGNLDLYAVWLLNSYTVTFDYTKGTGTPPSKEVLYGEEYGTLPPYLTTTTQNLFAGWYTAKEGGERVYPDTIVNQRADHTLYAHWDPSPANDVIKNLVVHNSADDDNDGVVDEIHLEFECSSFFEKFNIPLHNLVPGQQYKLSYTTSNNATFGGNESGYGTARYGSYILPDATKDQGNIDSAVAKDIIATWADRVRVNGDPAFLRGPWNREITFNATATDMYWAWEFGLIQDGPKYDYNLYNISLEPVPPTIQFGNKTVLKDINSAAAIVEQTNSAYSSEFTFCGAGGTETVYYPITGLCAGMTYSITFDHEYNGHLVQNRIDADYEYGCGIMNTIPQLYGNKMKDLGSFASNTYVKKLENDDVVSVTLTFTATSDRAYWVWNMANCKDHQNTTTKITISNFSASNAGSSVTFHTAASSAGSAAALTLLPEEEPEIQFVWEGIDDTNLESWNPVDEQYPIAGDDYELKFVPLDGYTMAESITVQIDDVVYEVSANGQVEEGVIAPAYNPESNILTIPGELLTVETTCVSVTASAVPAELSTTEIPPAEIPPVTEEEKEEEKESGEETDENLKEEETEKNETNETKNE